MQRPNLKSLNDYKEFINMFSALPLEQQTLVSRDMFRNDLFYLLTVGLRRKDMLHPWLLSRCKEVEANPNGYLDLWARGHYKSTIITFALTIQDILSSHGDSPDPKWGGKEPTIGFFSFNRPIAKQFLSQIKREFETNEVLRVTFPDIIWELPYKEAPSWSLDNGIILKRKSNPKEATIEAWGLVDGQPTSKHFDILVYDDVVTIDNVRSPDMIDKTTTAWELSLNLCAKNPIRRYIGTRYHFNDTYKSMMDRQAAKPRLHAATRDGTPAGDPVFMTRETLDEKYRNMGMYTFSSQMLQKPTFDQSQGFKKDWLLFADMGDFQQMNRYIVVDPANSKRKNSDYTAIMVVGLSADNNYYVIDMVRDKLSLTERTDVLFHLHRKYKPMRRGGVGYEQYGMQADISHIRDVQRRTNYNFEIVELGGTLSKLDRIRKLIPLFEQGRIYLPESCFKTNSEGKTVDLTENFVNEEYLTYPVAIHDDMLDSLARILDDKFKLVWPQLIEEPDRYAIKRKAPGGSVWSV